jgi:hypothetical protein
MRSGQPGRGHSALAPSAGLGAIVMTAAFILAVAPGDEQVAVLVAGQEGGDGVL